MSTCLMINVCGGGLERSGQGRLSPFLMKRLINSLRNKPDGRGRGNLGLEAGLLVIQETSMGRKLDLGLSKSSYTLSEDLRVRNSCG